MATHPADKTISLAELREPAKVFSPLCGEPVRFEAANAGDVQAALERRRPALAATLKYLEDK